MSNRKWKKFSRMYITYTNKFYKTNVGSKKEEYYSKKRELACQRIIRNNI